MFEDPEVDLGLRIPFCLGGGDVRASQESDGNRRDRPGFSGD
jgi:hypothetical protein